MIFFKIVIGIIFLVVFFWALLDISSDEFKIQQQQESDAKPVTTTFNVLSIDNDRLKAHYEKLAKRHRKKGKSDINQCYVTFVFQFLMCTIALFVVDEDSTRALLFIQEIIFIIFTISLISKKSTPYSVPVNAIKLNKSQFLELWEMAKQLLDRMNLNNYQLKIYYIKSSSIGCFVNEDRQQIFLFISRGFVANMDIAPKDCESILAHEFGHVYQGDGNLFFVNKNLLTVPGVLVIISSIIVAIVALISVVSGAGLPKLLGGINFVYVFTLITLNNKKTEAENLADLASLAYVENSTIKSVINNFSELTIKNIKYSNKTARLLYLEKAIAQFAYDQPVK